MPSFIDFVSRGHVDSRQFVSCPSLPHSYYYPYISPAITSALVAVGSCVLNDYFDLKTDRINNLERSLVQGRVRPLHALLLALACLSMALFVGNSVVPTGTKINGLFFLCRQTSAVPMLDLASAGGKYPGAENVQLLLRLLRRIVYMAVLAVSLYTPVFKPIPFLKNGVVSLVTAASVVLGGLAALAVSTCSSIPSSLPPSLLASASVVFCHMYHREILMDIDDTERDKAGHILTLPRLFGKSLALSLGGALVALSTAVSGWIVWTQHGLRLPSLPIFQAGGFRGGTGGIAARLAGEMGMGVIRASAAWFAPVAVCVAGLSICVYDWRVVWMRGFRHEDIDKGIAWCPLAMVVMLLLMGTGCST